MLMGEIYFALILNISSKIQTFNQKNKGTNFTNIITGIYTRNNITK